MPKRGAFRVSREGESFPCKSVFRLYSLGFIHSESELNAFSALHAAVLYTKQKSAVVGALSISG